MTPLKGQRQIPVTFYPETNEIRQFINGTRLVDAALLPDCAKAKMTMLKMAEGKDSREIEGVGELLVNLDVFILYVSEEEHSQIRRVIFGE